MQKEITVIDTSESAVESAFIERYAACPVCATASLQSDFRVDVLGLHLTWDRCGSCGLVFQNPRLSESTLAMLYAKTAYFGKDTSNPLSGYVDYVKNDPIRIAQSHRRIERIKNVTGIQTGRLLDIGSASGFFGYAAQQQGFDVTCVDPDQDLSEFGRKNYGLKFLTVTFDQCSLEPNSFDVITLWGTDSHFMHPLESFAKLEQLLKPGGLMCMNYQDFGHWVRLIFPNLKANWNALYNLTDRSFDEIMSRTGMSLVYRGLEWQTVTFDHIFRLLHFRTPPLVGNKPISLPAVSFRFVIAKKPDQVD